LSSCSEDQQIKLPTSPALVVDARNQRSSQEMADLYQEMNVFAKHRSKEAQENQELLDMIPSK
jgi:hypothetical protein